MVHHVLASFSCLLGVRASHDGEVGGVSRPERGGPESQQDRRGDQSVPVERSADMRGLGPLGPYLGGEGQSRGAHCQHDDICGWVTWMQSP